MTAVLTARRGASESRERRGPRALRDLLGPVGPLPHSAPRFDVCRGPGRITVARRRPRLLVDALDRAEPVGGDPGVGLRRPRAASRVPEYLTVGDLGRARDPDGPRRGDEVGRAVAPRRGPRRRRRPLGDRPDLGRRRPPRRGPAPRRAGRPPRRPRRRRRRAEAAAATAAECKGAKSDDDDDDDDGRPGRGSLSDGGDPDDMTRASSGRRRLVRVSDVDKGAPRPAAPQSSSTGGRRRRGGARRPPAAGAAVLPAGAPRRAEHEPTEPEAVGSWERLLRSGRRLLQPRPLRPVWARSASTSRISPATSSTTPPRPPRTAASTPSSSGAPAAARAPRRRARFVDDVPVEPPGPPVPDRFSRQSRTFAGPGGPRRGLARQGAAARPAAGRRRAHRPAARDKAAGSLVPEDDEASPASSPT